MQNIASDRQARSTCAAGWLTALLLVLGVAAVAEAQVSFTGCGVSSYRWTLEEDNSYAVTPGTIKWIGLR